MPKEMSSSTLSTPTKKNGGIVVQSTSSSNESPLRSSITKRRLDYIEPDEDSIRNQKKGRVLSSATRIYILPEKLSEKELDRLRDTVTQMGGLNSSLTFANVIVTSLRAEKRIVRHLSDEILKRKVAILHISWLYDSAQEKLLQPFGKYKLVSGTLDEEDLKEYSAKQEHPLQLVDDGDSQTEDEDEGKGSAGSREGSLGIENELCDNRASDDDHDNVSAPNQDQGPSWQNVEYSCLRPSPLKSRYNQALVDELEVLRLQRILAGKQDMNATAYGRAISAVKALPFSLAPTPSKARNVKGIGPKIAKLIEQFYKDGHIAESQSIRQDESFKIMTLFMELYGVGPKRAREYYSQGARTLDDVIKLGGSLGTHLHIQDCLRILPDLRSKIPRAEVLEIADIIQKELDIIRPGCLHTICGGFRRGKLESNDVDIVITDPNPANLNSQITCMEELLRQMKKKALITHVVNVTTPSSTFEAVYSHLDIAEVVMLPPTSSIVQKARHRRIDIIFCPYVTYGAAVLGWTGSRQFERDLRLLAKHRGFKFHSTGLVSQNGNRPHQTHREEDIFEILQIPFMPPHLRNCDA